MKLSKNIYNEIDELTKPVDRSLIATDQTYYEEAISDYEFPLCTKANKKIMLDQLEEAFAEAIRDNAYSKDDLVNLYECYKNSKKFIELLKPRFWVPEIYVESDGEIAFDWIASKTKYLSVSINAKGETIFAAIYHESRTRGRDVLSDEIPAQLLFQIERFTKDSLQKR